MKIIKDIIFDISKIVRKEVPETKIDEVLKKSRMVEFSILLFDFCLEFAFDKRL